MFHFNTRLPKSYYRDSIRHAVTCS